MRRLHRPNCPNPRALQANYKYPENKQALQNASHGKCMYCESQVAHIAYGDVEHFRPKADGKYPHLKFEWTNLGYGCTRCNNAKKDQFDETCPLIDPYSEDPDQHLIAFGSVVRHKTGSERGAITIKTVDLNRPELVERRGIKIAELQKAIDACYRTKSAAIRDDLLAELAREADLDKEFSMFAAALISANR
jgi:uncharacterized protein (TIGR02646 family)